MPIPAPSSRRRALASLLLLASALLPGGAAPGRADTPGPSTTIVVVRHAEKATDDPADPVLSAAGEARAAALSSALEGATVAAVFATQFKRTQATGAPVAKRFGVTVTPLALPGGDPASVSAYAERLVKEIGTKYAGKTVVIVGHSNTVPQIVQAFSGRTVTALSDADYDRLYIVVRPADGPAQLVVSRYGAPSTP